MAANFTVNITVAAGGVVNSTNIIGAFFNNNGQTQDPYFSFSGPTVIGSVVLSETTSTYTYTYGQYVPIFDGGNFVGYLAVDEGTGSGTRTESISIGGNSDALRALQAGQTADIAASYLYDAAYYANQYGSGYGELHNISSGTVTFHFTGVNDAPVLTDQTLSLATELEDAATPAGGVGTAVVTLLSGFTDYDNGAGRGIAISGADTAHGTWWYSINDGASWSQLGAVSESNARLLAASGGRIFFQPNANFNGTVDPAITFHAWDQSQGTSGGTANVTSNGGTTAFSTATDIASLTITAVNDPPAIASIGALSYTENQAAALLAPSASVTDIDSANFSGGLLKVSFTANGTSADQLTITTDTHVSVTSNTVNVDGADVGTLSGGANGAALQVSLNGNATPAAVQTLMRHIAYANTSDNPSTAARTVKFEVSDGSATGSATSTINITAVNDAPMINGVTLAVSEGGMTVLTAANFNIADPDSASFTYTVSNVTHGVFQTTTDGTTWTNATTFNTAAIAAGHVRFVHDGGEIAPSFSIQADDGAAANHLSGVAAGAVTYTPVNDAPVLPTPTLIDFQDIAHPLDGGFTSLASYSAGGFVLTSSHAGADAFESFHTGHTFYAGSAALANSYDGARTTLQRADGAVFDLDRIDLDSLLTGASSQVTFTGTLVSGATVQQTFTLDALRGFRTFAFGADFDHVVSVAWDQVSPYTTFDNIQLDPAPVFASITDRDIDNAGQTVGSLLANVADPDAGAVQGMAITAAVSGAGHWEYATGGAWVSFESLSESHALLLRASDLVRFVPDGGTATNASFVFHAWDQTGGTAGQQGTYADLSAFGSGGATPFSTAVETASITVLGNVAPTGTVMIAGAAIEDQTLTASNTLADGDGLGVISYQWLRNGAEIANATGSSYQLGDDDVGATISVRASYTDGGDNFESVTSALTGLVVNVNDAPTGAVVIEGNALENETLTARNTLADADGMGTVTYHWQRNGSDIANATGSTYQLGNDDVGATISVRATYTDGHGMPESVSSAATAPVVNVNDAPTGSVTIAGAAVENTVLVASNTLVDADGMGAVTYHWQRNGVDIANATGSTYQLDDADVGATISVRASYIDGHGTAESVASAATGTVLNVNDAPGFASASATLIGITEDDVANAGQTVGSFASAGITDADAGALAGIAITAHGDGNGHWEYRLFDAGTWTAIGTTSEAAALLLRAEDYVRFVPDARNGTSASLTYHAWDRTDGAQAGATADTTHNGGITAYSSAVATASIAVADVNDVAIITTSPVSTTESELPSFVSFNVGSRVTIVDVDSDDAAHPTGYVANSGSVTVSGPTPPSGTLASLLTLDQATGAVFYDRSAFHWLTGDESVTYTIAFQAQSGNDTPQNQTLTITVEGLNAAPVLTAPNHQSFPAMTEDAPGAAHKVSTFRGAIADSDHGSVAGIAITATAGNGDWQYSIDNGASWHGFAASDAAALLLRDQDLVRFAPDGKNGGEASFTYHAWDQTVGSAGGTADASATGGTTAFSAASDSVTLAVSSVNDAPVLTPAAPTLASISEDDVGNAGQTVASPLGASASDVDSGAVQGIALTGLTNGNGHWEYSLDGGSTWHAIGTVAESSALLLASDDDVRFVPDEKNGTSATLSYHAWDQTSGTHGHTVDLTVPNATGGTTAFSLATDTVSIAVTDVNDAPTVSGPVALTAVNEDTPRLITTAELLANANDVDTVHALTVTGLQIANGNGALADNHDGSWTYTPAPDDDTSVSFSFNLSDGIAAPISASATLDIIPVNDAPVAQADSAHGDEDTAITGTVGANDVDTPAGSLTYALVGQNGGAQHGTVTLDAHGAYTYTPDHDYFGPDSFSFTANDGQADSAAATIAITVDPVNDAPVITTGTPLSVAENQAFVAALGATDVDGPSAATFSITGGADAALFDIVNGNLVFRSARDYETQAHSYQVEITAFDGLDSSVRMLTVNLTDVNDNAPVFTSNANAPDIVPENTTGTVYAAAATDADGTAAGNTISYSLSGDDAALFAIDPTGKVHFVTAPDFETPKDRNHDNNCQVTVHANDGVHDAAQDVTITVTNINEAPIASHGVAAFEQTFSGELVASDVDSPTLTYALVSGPSHGTLNLHGDGTFSYAAALGYAGADSFSFKANDGALDSNVATYDLTIQQLHLAGTAGNDSFTALAGNERVDGGGGVNTVSFNFKLTDAAISFSGNQIIVDGPGGSSHTVLTDFEIFNFTDGTVDNTKGNALIDKLYYYSQYHDVWNAHADAEQHYMNVGWREGRNPDALFDTKGYLATYTDVAQAGVNPLTHYDQMGWREGRDPSGGFDTKAYLTANPDVAAAHVDPLVHFLASGIHEGRSAFADGVWG